MYQNIAFFKLRSKSFKVENNSLELTRIFKENIMTNCERERKPDWWWRWRRNVSFLYLCISISLLRLYTFFLALTIGHYILFKIEIANVEPKATKQQIEPHLKGSVDVDFSQAFQSWKQSSPGTAWHLGRRNQKPSHIHCNPTCNTTRLNGFSARRMHTLDQMKEKKRSFGRIKKKKKIANVLSIGIRTQSLCGWCDARALVAFRQIMLLSCAWRQHAGFKVVS